MYTIVNLVDKSKQSCNHKHVCAVDTYWKKNPATCQMVRYKNPPWNCCGLKEFSIILSLFQRHAPLFTADVLFFFFLYMHNRTTTRLANEKSISINIGVYRWQANGEQEVNIRLCNSVRTGAFPVWRRCFYRKPLRSNRILSWFFFFFFWQFKWFSWHFKWLCWQFNCAANQYFLLLSLSGRK